jgi:hypothetical protein
LTYVDLVFYADHILLTVEANGFMILAMGITVAILDSVGWLRPGRTTTDGEGYSQEVQVD